MKLNYLHWRLLSAAVLAGLPGCTGCNSEPVSSAIECGGTAKFRCPPGYYCDLGKDCGGFDKIGICRYQPTDCPNEDEPVCGCDGKNYSSPCYAVATGATVSYPGKCIEKF